MGIFQIDSARAPSPRITAKRREDRTVDELIGVCRGVLADGSINALEAEFLRGWIERNAGALQEFPYDVLFKRLSDALVDGVLDEEEERDLLFAISKFVGGEASGEFASESASLSTALPLDDPAPKVVMPDSVFVVTGTFAFGPRQAVTTEIVQRGGSVSANVSGKVAYLVVGSVGSRDWAHSSYGRKIEKAVQLRDEGAPIAIVHEDHWRSHL